MNDRNKQSDSELTACRSKVTPNAALKRKKDKLLFAGIIFVCVLIMGYSLLPAAQSKKEEQEHTSNASARETLQQNLAHIAKLRQQAQAYQEDTQTATTNPRNHPPILRDKSSTKSGLNQELLARMNAPSSFSMESSPSNLEESHASAPNAHSILVGNNANSQFVNQQEDVISVSAKRIPHPQYSILAGEMIPATLEVAINSDLPGIIRAITAQDIYSFTGSNKLIPKGSTLFGQYSSNIVHGQSRLLVMWNRVERSDGVVVTLNSPGADAIGRAGMGADRTNRHFLARFGSSALLSIIGGYAAVGGVGNQDQYNSVSQYRMGIATSLQQSASQTLQADNDIQDTLEKYQGAKINVFVAHDLDFSSVGAAFEDRTSQVNSRAGGVWK
ncbi:TPA: hypothetical protein JBF73_07750 [Legionella pneumophila]|nr:hypothetical protein [Legionella pneumophila]